MDATCSITAQARVNGSWTVFGQFSVQMTPGAEQVIEIGAPTLTVESPAPGASTDNSTITVTGTVTDELGVEVTVNGVTATLTPTGNPDEQTFSATIPLGSGANQIVTVATNSSGQTATDTRTVTLTNAAPTADAGGPYTAPEGGSVQLDGSGSSDPDPGDTLSYEWDLDYDGINFSADVTGSSPLFDATGLDGPSSSTVALRVTDSVGAASNIDTTLVTIDNVAPTASAGQDQSGVEWARGLTVTLDGSGSSDPVDPISYSWTDSEGTVVGTTTEVTVSISGLGANTFALTVDDGDGASHDDSVTITVVDTISPEITGASAAPSVLWPPNHKMQAVTVAVDVSDACDANPTCEIVSVTSDEPVNDKGDGNTSPDWEITGDLTVDLRAERSGQGDGRVYTITIECRDSSDNSSTTEVTVTVPHDQGNGQGKNK